MKIVAVLLCVWFLVACSSDKQVEADRPEGAIPQAQLQALEKAKAVEQTLLDADAARRAKADEATSPE
ncbi:hypothetical protein QWY82_05695 [Simiduia curdlanivorans]|uniref:Lipoprotein n=1 Tax=Simiduia curdlanivorans TaxID=1492769 RepID=A0ABV8V3R9_9GAMM|nr:hypothetical protein [Simiduia curdlanivorans]MDN3638304.1 hypothetical protein [Simiduia curdlanivorans]